METPGLSLLGGEPMDEACLPAVPAVKAQQHIAANGKVRYTELQNRYIGGTAISVEPAEKPLHSNLCSGPWENQTIQNSLRVRSGSVLRKYYL